MGNVHLESALRGGGVALTLVSLLAAWAPSAEAAPIHWSRVYVSASAGILAGGTTSDSGKLFNIDTIAPLTATRSGAPWGHSASGTAVASVADGALRASAVGTGGLVPPNSYHSGTGQAMAWFFDTFKLESSTLAPGTAVTLQFDLELTYNLVGGGCGGNVATVYGYTTLNGAITAGAVRSKQDSTCDTSDFTAGTGLATGYIGQEFVAESFLSATASSFNPAFTASANAGNTLRLVVTPLGDFTFTTSSGNTYQASQPVPEPASVGLVLAGMAALVGAHRRLTRREVSLEAPRD